MCESYNDCQSLSVSLRSLFIVGHLFFFAQAMELNDEISNLRTPHLKMQGRCQGVINVSS